jgi:uncharacterized protein YkwD
MPFLRIHVGGQTFEAPLPEGAVRVGTALTCDLTLSCEGVGSEHCLLEPMAGGQWRLKDLLSGRPTRINGTEVRQVSLKPGDVIQVGAAEIVFAPEEVPASAPASANRGFEAAPAEANPQGASDGADARTAAATPEAAASVTVTERGAARGPAPVAGVRAHGGGRRLLLAITLLALIGGVLAALGLSGGGAGDAAALEARARTDLEAALGRYRAHDYLGAQQDLAALVGRLRTGEVLGQARTWHQSASVAVAEGQKKLDEWRSLALEFDTSVADSRREVFLAEHGRSFAPRVDAALEAIRAEQDAWRQAEAARVEADAATLVAASKYRDARARWLKSKASAPRGIAFTAAVDAGLARVDAAATTGGEALLERVERAVTHRGAAAGAEMLSAALANYEGTGVQGKLADRLQALEALAKEQRPPASPSTEPAPSPGPAPTRPPTPAGPTDPALVERVRADVAQAVRGRAFARAVERVDAALAASPHGPAKQELEALRGDLALARNGLDLLASDLTAAPARYGRIELAPTVFVAPTAADRDGITAAVSGGTTRLLWATMKSELLVLLAERMQPTGPDLVPVAALLHLVGAGPASERLLVKAWEGGGDKAALFEILGRWRGEPVPEGGYVPYEGRFVTTQERERLVQASRIRGATDRYGTARDGAGRKAAVEELLALGAPAHAALEKALRDRRTMLSDDLVARKLWSSARTRQRLWELLEKRRAHALALIEDAGAYPYPNPSHQGQAEVERRVAEVRDVWERPFGLVASFEPDVREALDGITEVDEDLARALPGYKPDLAALEAAAGRAVDMPSYAPPGAAGVREYSLKVLSFNERVATTATPEEKDNVRAVNEYRMMMGRTAVKIEERLVRTARGHSRHMRENKYFAHDAPAAFPELRDPSTRAKRQGYGGGVGENIAWGTPTGRDAFQAWFGSSGHHRNMLGRGWTEMGAGHALPSHWTQNFGAQGGRGLGEPAALPAPAADVAPESEDAAGRRPDTPLVPRLPDEQPPGQPPGLPDPGEGVPGEGDKPR